MKHALLIALVSLVSAAAQAKTVCNVNSSSTGGQSMIFDQILTTVEVKGTQFLMVDSARKEATAVEEGAFAKLMLQGTLQGKTIVSIMSQPDGQIFISVGRMNLANRENSFETDAVSTSRVSTAGENSSLVLPRRNLSIICFNVQGN